MRTLLTAQERAEHASESRKKWYRANKERRAAQNREWSSINKEKRLLTNRRYKAKHRKELNEKARLYRLRNLERCKAANKKWATAFPERKRASVVNWTARNNDKVRRNTANRRAAIKQRVHAEHDRAIELEIINRAAALTKQTGTRHQVDHIIPLKAGGWHHHLNLQILPISINASKNDNALWEQDGYKSWRDVPEYLWPETLVPTYRCFILAEKLGVAA